MSPTMAQRTWTAEKHEGLLEREAMQTAHSLPAATLDSRCCSRDTSTARPAAATSASPLMEGTTRPCFHPPCFLSLWGLRRTRSCEIDCPHAPPDWLLTRPPSPPHTSPPGCTEGPPHLSEKWPEPFSSLPRPLVIRAEEVQCDNS